MRYSDKRMRPHANKKIYSLRHFLFYLGLAMVGGALTGALKAILHWSNGLTFVVGLVAATIIATLALREDMFERPHPSPSKKPRRQLG
jgi:putative flippase GtrA